MTRLAEQVPRQEKKKPSTTFFSPGMALARPAPPQPPKRGGRRRGTLLPYNVLLRFSFIRSPPMRLFWWLRLSCSGRWGHWFLGSCPCLRCRLSCVWSGGRVSLRSWFRRPPGASGPLSPVAPSSAGLPQPGFSAVCTCSIFGFIVDRSGTIADCPFCSVVYSHFIRPPRP